MKLLGTYAGENIVWKRPQAVRCGHAHFPIDNKARNKVSRWLFEYKKSKRIDKLAFRLLTRLHPFLDGNGRLARLLISWHAGKLLLFKTNHQAHQEWTAACRHHNSSLFRKLIARTTKELHPICELFGGFDTTTSLTSTLPNSTTDTTTTQESRSLDPTYYIASDGWFSMPGFM